MNEMIKTTDAVLQGQNRLRSLTTQQKKLIEAIYAKGMAENMAWKECYGTPYTRMKCAKLLSKDSSVQYIQRIQNSDNSELEISKDSLVKELLKRLPSSNDKDAVQIVRTLSTMLGYFAPDQQEINNHIEIVWQSLNHITETTETTEITELNELNELNEINNEN